MMLRAAITLSFIDGGFKYEDRADTFLRNAVNKLHDTHGGVTTQKTTTDTSQR